MFGRVAILAGLLSVGCATREGESSHEVSQELSHEQSANKEEQLLSQEFGGKPVTDLDVDAFLGRWYQMYGSISSTLLTFGNAGPQDTCVTADYSLNEDGTTIDVLNQGIRLDGGVTKIYGKNTPTDKVGQFKLTFQKFLRQTTTTEEVGQQEPTFKEIAAPDFEGDYLVFSLGPKVDGKYAYAVVGGPLSLKLGLDKTQLFVLARDPVSWSSVYDEEVKTLVKENGFNWWWNKPRKTGSVGKFQSIPYPKFGASDHDHGEWGQNKCASVKGLTPPPDDQSDPRVA